MESIKMVEVTRSDEVESFHQGVAVLINSSGEILKEWGNSEKLIYPNKSKAMNLAFDVTPAKYVTGLITEKGICEASTESLKKLFNK